MIRRQPSLVPIDDSDVQDLRDLLERIRAEKEEQRMLELQHAQTLSALMTELPESQNPEIISYNINGISGAPASQPAATLKKQPSASSSKFETLTAPRTRTKEERPGQQ